MAVANLLDHFEIEHRALIKPLGLNQFALRFEFFVPPLQLVLDALHRLVARGGIHHVVGLGINRQPHVGLLYLADERINLAQRFNFVAPQLDAIGVVVVGGVELNHVAANAKRAAPEVVIVALIKNLDQPLGNLFPADALALLEHQQHAVIGLRRSQAVDAAYAGDDNAIAPLEQANALLIAAACPAHR